MTIFFTPATFAGTAFMSTVEGYAAVPPGTYIPTQPIGVNFCPKTVPFREISKPSGSCFSWKRAIFSAEVFSMRT